MDIEDGVYTCIHLARSDTLGLTDALKIHDLDLSIYIERAATNPMPIGEADMSFCVVSGVLLFDMYSNSDLGSWPCSCLFYGSSPNPNPGNGDLGGFFFTSRTMLTNHTRPPEIDHRIWLDKVSREGRWVRSLIKSTQYA